MMGAGTSYGVCNDHEDQDGIYWHEVYNFEGQKVGKRITQLFGNPDLPWWKLHPVIHETGIVEWTNPNITAEPWQKPDIRTDYKADFPDTNQVNSNYLIYFPKYKNSDFNKIKEGTLLNILKKPGAKYTVTWYHPTEGRYIPGNEIITYNGGTNGSCLDIPPKPDDNDWVLWLSLIEKL